MCKRLLVGVAHFLPQGVDTMVCHTKQKEKEIEETNKQAKNEFYILKIGHKKNVKLPSFRQESYYPLDYALVPLSF